MPGFGIEIIFKNPVSYFNLNLPGIANKIMVFANVFSFIFFLKGFSFLKIGIAGQERKFYLT